jgi:hypothetical protein
MDHNRDFASIQYVPAGPFPTTDKQTLIRTRPKVRRPYTENEGLFLFILRWTCAVLTVAAAIVFGIWAPLSYKATVEANNDGNAAQSSALSVALAASSLAAHRNDMASSANSMALRANDMARTANKLASSASSIADDAWSLAVSQSSVLQDVHTRIAALGQLWMVDFCINRTVRAHHSIRNCHGRVPS